MLKPRSVPLLRSALIVQLMFSMAACNLPAPAAHPGGQAVQLMQPLAGAQLSLQEEVSVVSTFSDPDGARAMTLEVNGVAVREDRFYSPIFQGRMDQPWRPADSGRAVLCVILSTADGSTLRSNCVDVVVGGTGSLTLTPFDTSTPNPDLTATPTRTPTPTLSATPGQPMATANQNANCRLGPGLGYAVRTSLVLGQTAPIVGRNEDSSWWVIEVTGAGQCWIWEDTVDVSGDTGRVPVVTPPALPTLTSTPAAIVNAPSPLSPSGTQNCAQVTGGVTLKWSPVSHPDGLSSYDWELTGPISDSGSTAATQASTKTLSCGGAVFQWRVRAVGTQGQLGPWSAYTSFDVP